MSQENRGSSDNREENCSNNPQTPPSYRLPYGNPVTFRPMSTEELSPESTHSVGELQGSNANVNPFPPNRYIQDVSTLAAGQARTVLENIDLATEDTDLQRAINNSIQDTPKRKDRQSSPQLTSNDESPSKRSKSSPTFLQPELNIDAVMNNAEKVHRSTLPFLVDDAADTFVFLLPPPLQPELGRKTYGSIIERYSRPLQVRTEILDSLDSPRIKEMLGPTAQFRVKRRLHRRGILTEVPSHIKYVIDLTPPTEGDEATELVAMTYCSQTIREWYKAADRWGISWVLIGGPDDFAIPFEDTYRSKVGHETRPLTNVKVISDDVAVFQSTSKQNSREASSSLSKPKPRDDPKYSEYSSVRHTSCIERVLLAAYGIDPKLDSAPKVWTTVMVAKHMGGKHKRLTDWIVRWLRAPPNSCFVEVLPEATLQIADVLEVSTLCQDSFAILVGEEALASVCQGRSVAGFDHWHTVFGRKRSDVPEAYRTRIEYASKQFKERIAEEFKALAGNDMRWVEELPELKKLLDDEFVSRACGRNLDQLKDTLKGFLRGAVYHVLLSNYNTPVPFLNSSSGSVGENLFPTTSVHSTWRQLHHEARILTRSFWIDLKFIIFNGANSDDDNASNYSISFPGPYAAMVSNNELGTLEAAGVFQLVKKSSLDHNISECYDKCNRANVLANSSYIHDGALHELEGVATGSSYQMGDRSFANNVRITPPSTEFLLPLRFRSKSPRQPTSPHHDTQANPNDGKIADGTYWDELLASEQNTLENFFSLPNFFGEVGQHFHDLSERMQGGTSPDFDLQLTSTLVCLNEEEKKYLPLWAEGLDDESGGVFNDDLPTADMGFTAPGPQVHTGGAGSTASSSDFEMMERSDAGSSYHTSTIVNDGTSDHLDRHHVYDNDSIFGEIMATKAAGLARPTGREEYDVSFGEGSDWDLMTEGGGGGEASVAPPPLPLDKGKGKMVYEAEEEEEDYGYEYEDGEDNDFSGEVQEEEEE